MSGRDGLPSLLLLGVASSLSPFGMIVVVPTLASVASRYAIAPGAAQLLVAAYLFGLGIGQPVTGALSDRYGRRPVILAGFAVFTLASLACTLAPTFGALLGARFVQALGISVGTVGARAIVRDTHDALGAARALAWIGAVMGIAPVAGPVIGGAVGAWAGPNAVFATSALLGLAVSAALAMRLRETRPPRAPEVTGPSWRTSYRELLRSRAFMGYTLMYAFTQGCFFAFLAVAAVVFQDHLGLGEEAFGIIWGLMGLVYVAAATGTTKLIGLVGTTQALLSASIASALAGLGLAAATGLWGVTAAGLIGPLLVLMGAAGVQSPLSVAGAVNVRPDISGTAAGLSSSLALVVSGTFSIVSGLLYTGSFMPIAAIMAGCAALTVVTGGMAVSSPETP